MAGGIDWFRWHHGSVTDPKFQLVARKAGASLPDVLAVWAYLLEQASASERRGCIGEIDAEALDCLFGFPSTETRTANILKAFNERGLIESGTVTAWEKRQPKRERDTDNSAERTRQYRERQKTPTQATESHVTPCDATERQENARGEERREEEKEEAPTVLVDPPSANRPPACPNAEIVSLYHQHLPTLPRVDVLNDGRKRAIAARWREVLNDPDIKKSPTPRDAALEFFDWFFDHASKSKFLTGRAKDWRADLDFLMTPSKFVKVIEGHYHRETA